MQVISLLLSNLERGEHVELIEVIHKRRSVRDYMDIAIDPSTIQSLVDAAIQAPSAMNRQPWEFCVFLDRKRIDDLSRRVKGKRARNTPVGSGAIVMDSGHERRDWSGGSSSWPRGD